MVKKVAILQSNYIPWKGYFDMVATVDEFILYDDMQFTKNDWRNRNQIKTSQGLHWLSIPVGKSISRRIRDVTTDSKWQATHWKTLVQNYNRAPHFREIAEFLEPLYTKSNFSHLSQANRAFIEAICGYLSIDTRISNSWDYSLKDGKTERLVDLCIQAGGTEYISGPAAKNYLEEKTFKDAGITLTWFDYQGYPEYPQLWGKFTHNVTILDLLFNCGKDSSRFMRYVA
jgi:hypothetical protein